MADQNALPEMTKLEKDITKATKWEGIFRAFSLLGLAAIGIGGPLAIAAVGMRSSGAVAASELDAKYEADGVQTPKDVAGNFNFLWHEIDSTMLIGVWIAVGAAVVAVGFGIGQSVQRSKARKAELERERLLSNEV